MKEIEGIQSIKVTILRIQLGWHKKIPKFVLYVKLKDMGSQECTQIESEVKDRFIRHVGQHMLDINYVEQPQHRELIQNTIEERM